MSGYLTSWTSLAGHVSLADMVVLSSLAGLISQANMASLSS